MTGNGLNPTCKYGDDWGMVYDCFTRMNDMPNMARTKIEHHRNIDIPEYLTILMCFFMGENPSNPLRSPGKNGKNGKNGSRFDPTGWYSKP